MYSNYNNSLQNLLFDGMFEFFPYRYWTKVKEIAGNINSGPRLTNYALTLIVLYYLQSLETPLIPTVKQLADLNGMHVRN